MARRLGCNGSVIKLLESKGPSVYMRGATCLFAIESCPAAGPVQGT
jgi:hypothetical protein